MDAAAPVAGWIEIAGDRIVATGVGDAHVRPMRARRSGDAGYVDVHSHGGGASFVTKIRMSRRALAAHGAAGDHDGRVLVTGALADLERQVPAWPGSRVGHPAGVHLEGRGSRPSTGAHRRIAPDRTGRGRATLDAGRGHA